MMEYKWHKLQSFVFERFSLFIFINKINNNNVNTVELTWSNAFAFMCWIISWLHSCVEYTHDLLFRFKSMLVVGMRISWPCIDFSPFPSRGFLCLCDFLLQLDKVSEHILSRMTHGVEESCRLLTYIYLRWRDETTANWRQLSHYSNWRQTNHIIHCRHLRELNHQTTVAVGIWGNRNVKCKRKQNKSYLPFEVTSFNESQREVVEVSCSRCRFLRNTGRCNSSVTRLVMTSAVRKSRTRITNVDKTTKNKFIIESYYEIWVSMRVQWGIVLRA